MDGGVGEALQGGEQVAVSPVLVGGAQGADDAAGVRGGGRGGVGVDEAVEECVALGGSGQGEAKGGFNEDAGEFGFQGGCCGGGCVRGRGC